LEIYNETVIDLLKDNSENLMIVEDPQKGVVVPDLTEYIVKDPHQILKLILEGNKRRTMAATGMNKFSSRSHAILQISLQQKSRIRDTVDECVFSKFLLVDLAGSERGGLEKGKTSLYQRNKNT
jgi:kinesin family protein 18/19